MKHSGAPSIGDIVTVTHSKERTGLVVKEQGREIGIQYFKSSRMKGMPAAQVWWVYRDRVRIISAARAQKFNAPSSSTRTPRVESLTHLTIT